MTDVSSMYTALQFAAENLKIADYQITKPETDDITVSLPKVFDAAAVTSTSTRINVKIGPTKLWDQMVVNFPFKVDVPYGVVPPISRVIHPVLVINLKRSGQLPIQR